MAQLAPVAPPQMLLKMKEEGLLGDYHLLLAHDIVDQQALYEDVFEDYTGYIILDNSLIELGYPAPIEMMLEAAKIVEPDVVVLPDYLSDMPATIKGHSEAIWKWNDAGLGPFMAVPQGKTVPEVIECCETLMKLPWIEAWGLPRVITDLTGSRREVLDHLIMLDDHRTIHLLGFSNDLRDDIACAKDPFVKGIDSAVPIRMGLHDIEMQDLLDNPNELHPARGDYWKTDEGLNDLARQNLESVRSWIEQPS